MHYFVTIVYNSASGNAINLFGTVIASDLLSVSKQVLKCQRATERVTFSLEDKQLVKVCKVCTISFERPVNYLCDAWHVFPPKYEAWTHFNN